MDRLKDYSISFKGLKDGTHKFEYQIGASFFEMFENALVKNGELTAVITLNKSQKLLIVDFSINGNISTVCDNCLGPIQVNIDSSERIYFNFGHEYAEQSEEIIVLPYEEHQINVAQWIYEFISINIPLRNVHPDDENGNSTCNAQMIDKLNEYLIKEEKTTEKKEDKTDPRWDALKKLIN
ncbi:MAG: DUF177 domain-containing protein [Chlorobi bacterium]|nr:DUF177 domain-containing protein [Chlorobiota bacterium]